MLRPLACFVPDPTQDPPMLVSNFIGTTTVSWNTKLLQKYFLPMDIEIIKAIPLSTRRMTDRCAWHYEKNRLLTVRSMYGLLVHTTKRRED
jgi:hypothetical protein